MTRPDPIGRFRTTLAQHIAARPQMPRPNPLPISPWAAMSMLQKAVRRGQRDHALNAAATLLRDAPERLWRRCGCVAFEDIGVADLATVGLVTSALAGKRLRQSLGGEWAVASMIVDLMVNAKKSRAADDLVMGIEGLPELAERRREFASLSTQRLRAIAIGTSSLHLRGLAVWYLLGTDPYSSKQLLPRNGEPSAAFNLLADIGVAPSMVEIAREGFCRTGDALCPLVGLLTLENGLRGDMPDDPLPPETMIGDLPGWALDMYTREGRAALTRLLSRKAGISNWTKTMTPVAGRVEFLGQLLFRVEGGVLTQRVGGDLGTKLRAQVDFECLGIFPDRATEALALMRADLPFLNAIRAEIMEGSNDAR